VDCYSIEMQLLYLICRSVWASSTGMNPESCWSSQQTSDWRTSVHWS